MPRGLAGHSAGVEVNAYQERWLRGVDRENVARGLKPIDIHTFTTATDVIAALRAGQVDTAILIDQTAREVERRKLVTITATGLGGAPTTLVFRNRAVAQAVAETLTAMRADGFYDALFDRYGLTKYPDRVFAIHGPGTELVRKQARSFLKKRTKKLKILKSFLLLFFKKEVLLFLT